MSQSNEPIRITEQFWHTGTQPLVSISCRTYNHEKFIRDAIEGILMQKTTFPVELIIHDDASTDSTADIIRDYEIKYPHIIKPIYQEENQYSKGVKIGLKYIQPKVKGKYYAICEGDDYWIDPLKLQKQIDFLEENTDYVLSFTNCNFLFEEKGKIRESACENNLAVHLQSKEDLFYSIIEDRIKIITPSVVYRTGFIHKLKNDKKFKMGDTPLWLTLSQFGKFHFLDEPTTVYRFSRGTVTRPTSRVDRIGFRVSGLLMRFYYLEKFNYQIPEALLQKYEVFLIQYLKLGGIYDLDKTRYLSETAIQRIKKLEGRSALINKMDYYLFNPRVLAFELKEKIVKNMEIIKNDF